MRRLVTTTYLEMASRAELRPARPGATPFQLVRAEVPCPELNRFLYAAVGARWWWYSRLPWDYARWLAYLDRPALETWVAYVSGTPAGYFELERQDDGAVELAYFGLLPAFIGRGLGGALLTAAIARGWEMGARRVWVHTCDLDHPQALANYRARGFRIVRAEERMEELPDEPLEPWPGAGAPARGTPATRRADGLTYVAPVLRVADLPRSLSYYRDRLGFEIEFVYDGFYASVRRDGCRIHLKCAAPPERDQAALEAAQHLDACLGVVDAGALAARLAAAGAQFAVPLRRMPYGTEFYVRDPDGYILGFVQSADAPGA